MFSSTQKLESSDILSLDSELMNL